MGEERAENTVDLSYITLCNINKSVQRINVYINTNVEYEVFLIAFYLHFFIFQVTEQKTDIFYFAHLFKREKILSSKLVLQLHTFLTVSGNGLSISGCNILPTNACECSSSTTSRLLLKHRNIICSNISSMNYLIPLSAIRAKKIFSFMTWRGRHNQ